MAVPSDYRTVSYVLGAIYGAIFAVAALQLTRFHVFSRVWTTQKMYHLFLGGLCLLRCSFLFSDPDFFQSIADWDHTKATSYEIVLVNLPPLFLFTAYTLLVLFWAKLYIGAAGRSASSFSGDCPYEPDSYVKCVRPLFICINVVAYLFEVAVVVLWKFEEGAEGKLWLASTVFIGALYLGTSIGFIYSGCRVYKLLEKVPAHRDILRPKLREVSAVTAVCGICFSLRFVLDLYLAVQYFLFVENDPRKLNPAIATIVMILGEILPSFIILYYHRKLPPSRGVALVLERRKDVAGSPMTFPGTPSTLEAGDVNNGSSLSKPLL